MGFLPYSTQTCQFVILSVIIISKYQITKYFDLPIIPITWYFRPKLTQTHASLNFYNYTFVWSTYIWIGQCTNESMQTLTWTTSTNLSSSSIMFAKNLSLLQAFHTWEETTTVPLCARDWPTLASSNGSPPSTNVRQFLLPTVCMYVAVYVL